MPGGRATPDVWGPRVITPRVPNRVSAVRSEVNVPGSPDLLWKGSGAPSLKRRPATYPRSVALPAPCSSLEPQSDRSSSHPSRAGPAPRAAPETPAGRSTRGPALARRSPYSPARPGTVPRGTARPLAPPARPRLPATKVALRSREGAREGVGRAGVREGSQGGRPRREGGRDGGSAGGVGGGRPCTHRDDVKGKASEQSHVQTRPSAGEGPAGTAGHRTGPGGAAGGARGARGGAGGGAK